MRPEAAAQGPAEEQHWNIVMSDPGDPALDPLPREVTISHHLVALHNMVFVLSWWVLYAHNLGIEERQCRRPYRGTGHCARPILLRGNAGSERPPQGGCTVRGAFAAPAAPRKIAKCLAATRTSVRQTRSQCETACRPP